MNQHNQEGKSAKITSFADLRLSKEVLTAIRAKGFDRPTKIQQGIIPLLLQNQRDIIGQAQTGTGKTAAFALPLLEQLDRQQKNTQAIILAPTRELAIQVSKEIQSLAGANSPTVEVVYGGNNLRQETQDLKKKPSIVVGTPGRMQHHLRKGSLRIDQVRYFILDEADEMLNFGFREEIEEILAKTPPQRRVLLFSATMPPSIMSIVQKYLAEYDLVKVPAKEMTSENISQKYFILKAGDKFEALCRIMEEAENFYAIIFCRTKIDVDLLANKLTAKHLKAAGIHGDIDQKKREKILTNFRQNKTNILVATDVAARGIDIERLDYVVNYSLPESYELYAHRVGRTGRAGHQGVAITFITPSEESRLRFFERNLKIRLELGTLPPIKQLLNKKKEHLIARIEHRVNNENLEDLRTLAEDLLEEGDSVKVVAALIREAYGDSYFDSQSYQSIEQPARGGPTSKRGKKPFRSRKSSPHHHNRKPATGKKPFGNRAKGNFKRGRR
jgi:ATP-dependent RNA helicase DeaD